MLRITSVAGNIFDGSGGFGALGEGDFERLVVSRAEMGRSRLRRQTTGGTDVGLLLEGGAALRNGDVLSGGPKPIVVEQLPEKVVTVRPRDGANAPESLALVGHAIGNRHRPISLEGGAVSFPIQADAELEVFEGLFARIVAGGVDLSAEERVFSPHGGADVHDHG